MTVVLLSLLLRLASRKDANNPGNLSRSENDILYIRVSRYKCALFLCVQENTQVLLQQNMTRLSANEPHDDIPLPDCQIFLEITVHMNIPQFYYQTKLINKEILIPSKFVGSITVVSHSGEDQSLLLHCSDSLVGNVMDTTTHVVKLRTLREKTGSGESLTCFRQS